MKRQALLIGVSTSPAGNLRGPDDDVAEVVDKICIPRGLIPIVLANHEATRDGILDALRSLVDDSAQDDVVLFYFAGHGTRVTSDEEPGLVHEALCPCDFEVADPRRGIRDFELHALLARAQERGAQVTAVFDCCFSGGMSELERDTSSARGIDVPGLPSGDVDGDGSRRAAGNAAVRYTRMVDVPEVRGRPVAVFAACQAHERAWEETHDRKVLGVFTRHLTAAAAAVADAEISNGELLARVSASLLAERRPNDRAQRPSLTPAELASSPFLGTRGGDGRPPEVSSHPEIRRAAWRGHPELRFERPLRTYVCWARRDTDEFRDAAVDLYEFLARDVEAQPVVRPSLSIPTEVGRDVGDLLAKLRDGSEPFAERYAVIAMLGAQAFGDAGFREQIGELVQLAARRTDVDILPIVGDWRWNERLRRAPVATVRGGEDPQRRWRVAARVALALGASIRANAEPRRRGVGMEPLRAFIAMARPDAGPPIEMNEVHDALAQLGVRSTPTSTGIHRAREIAAQLDEAGDAAVLVVLRTDHLAESPACTQAILAAKRRRIPILTVLATSSGEVRAPTYGGNHRTILWRAGREWEIVARCVQAWLHHHHFRRFGRAAIHLAGLPADSTVLSRAPELVDLRPDLRGLVVYPDPPLSEDERAALGEHRPDLRVATPNSLFGRVLMDGDPAPPLAGTRIALSLSDASDLQPLRSAAIGRGLGREHLLEVLDAIVLSTIQSGASIDYGGHFNTDGFAVQLSDRIVSYRRLGLTPDEELCRPRPSRALLHCYQHQGAREGAGSPVYEPIEVALPVGHDACDAAHHGALWQLAMRHEVSTRTKARVLLGAALRSHHVEPAGYLGAWPGVLEEAYRTVQAGGALFVVGGFGGCAGAIARMLEADELPPEFQTERLHANAALAEQSSTFAAARLAAAAQLGADAVVLAVREGHALGAEDFASTVLSSWQRFVERARAERPGAPRPRWDNGLDEGENLQLFSSTDPTEISHLIFAGLVRIRDRLADKKALQLRCYHGDIGAVPEVDAYAVTVTPGLEPLGASASLDRRCGGRVRRAVPGDAIDAIEIGTSTLAGRYVLAASLPLPANASATVEPEVIERLAAEIGRKCESHGLSSIACTPFGASLDLPVDASVRAMLKGFRAAGAPSIVTFCEVDEGRHRMLRQALAGEIFEELHEGPPTPRETDTLLLSVEAAPPHGDRPGTVRSMLHHPGMHATVPAGVREIDPGRWMRLRRRSLGQEELLEQADDARAMLPAEVLALLDERPESALSIIVDCTAAGLPWELLGADRLRNGAPRRGCVTRRIRHDAGAMPIAATVRGNRPLRVLVVADPTDDLPAARRESARLVDLFGRRDHVVLTAIVGREHATRARLRTELAKSEFDVLHYAGHGVFDPKDSDACGLVLADGIFASTDLPATGVPSLVVLAACYSAQIPSTEGEPTGDLASGTWSIAEGVLRRGVRAFLGAAHPVSDQAALEFVVQLYTRMVAGYELGEAVRDARMLLHRVGRTDWATFQLYGDLRLTL